MTTLYGFLSQTPRTFEDQISATNYEHHLLPQLIVITTTQRPPAPFNGAPAGVLLGANLEMLAGGTD